MNGSVYLVFYSTLKLFTGLDQTSQMRPFTLKGDTLSWRVAARPDGSIPVSVFRRIQ
jgi:hypothetical protein